MTLELWQRQLSEEEGALERHHNLVKVVIEMIVDRGFNYGCHENWGHSQTEVLKLEKIEQVVVSRPGALFYPADDYLEAFPKGLDHHRRDGHYEGHLDGEAGVYVPQKRVRKSQIQFHPAIEARVNCGRWQRTLDPRPVGRRGERSLDGHVHRLQYGGLGLQGQGSQ